MTATTVILSEADIRACLDEVGCPSLVSPRLQAEILHGLGLIPTIGSTGGTAMWIGDFARDITRRMRVEAFASLRRAV